jgi:hypothetical protein
MTLNKNENKYILIADTGFNLEFKVSFNYFF